MCLCNGTGGVTTERSWGAEFAPCPDTNCQFDRAAEKRKYKEWWDKVERYFENGKIDHSA